jgi:hypothetical protein
VINGKKGLEGTTRVEKEGVLRQRSSRERQQAKVDMRLTDRPLVAYQPSQLLRQPLQISLERDPVRFPVPDVHLYAKLLHARPILPKSSQPLQDSAVAFAKALLSNPSESADLLGERPRESDGRRRRRKVPRR